MKERMIEFVRERVVLANNKDCETPEEALNKELKNPQCLIKYKSSENNYDISSIGEFTINIMSISSDKDFQKQMNDNLELILNQKSNKGELIALGLPLNLERVLVALQKDFKQEFAICGDFKCRVWYYDNVEEIFSWKPNKLLEGQSDETIEKIAKILGYVE